MAHSTLKSFDKITEAQIQNFYRTLSEKDQRRYAAIQARQLGRGGIVYLAELPGCSTRIITRGMNELDDDPTPISNDLPNPSGDTIRVGCAHRHGIFVLHNILTKLYS